MSTAGDRTHDTRVDAAGGAVEWWGFIPPGGSVAIIDTLPAELVLRVDGREASQELREHIMEVEVESRLYEPAAFRIRIDLGNGGDAAGDGFAAHVARVFEAGTRVEIVHESEGREVLLVSGDVHSIGLDLRGGALAGAAFAVVRGRDRSARALGGEARTRRFENMRLSDIAAAIVEDAGLRAEVQRTPDVLARVVQPRITDWAFLVHLARRAGHVVYVRDDVLAFGAPGGGEVVDLEWGEGLVSFQPELNLSTQTGEVEVHDWEPSPTHVERAVAGKGEVSLGNPALWPDCTVRVRGLGDALGIVAYIVETVHRFVSGEGYVTRFSMGEVGRDGGDWIRGSASASGQGLFIHHAEGAEGVEIVDGGGNRVLVDGGSGRVLIKAEDDLALIAGGTLRLSGGEIDISATESDVRIEAHRDIDIGAQLTASFDGQRCEVSAKEVAVIKGSLVQIN